MSTKKRRLIPLAVTIALAIALGFAVTGVAQAGPTIPQFNGDLPASVQETIDKVKDAVGKVLNATDTVLKAALDAAKTATTQGATGTTEYSGTYTYEDLRGSYTVTVEGAKVESVTWDGPYPFGADWLGTLQQMLDTLLDQDTWNTTE